jgi:hypothetical protein
LDWKTANKVLKLIRGATAVSEVKGGFHERSCLETRNIFTLPAI